MTWAWPPMGAVLGGVFVGVVRRRNGEAGRRRMSAAGLVVAAAVYVCLGFDPVVAMSEARARRSAISGAPTV